MRYTSIINFGKYKGRRVYDIVEENPEYLKWAIENTNCHPDQCTLDKLKDKGYEVTKIHSRQGRKRLKNNTI